MGIERLAVLHDPGKVKARDAFQGLIGDFAQIDADDLPIAVDVVAALTAVLLEKRGSLGDKFRAFEAVKSVEIINALKPDLVVLDCPSTNIPAYRDYIVQRLDNKNMEVHAEHKADVNHPVVSAASIIAKVTRDEEIEKLKKKINLNFGSGYPSNCRRQKSGAGAGDFLSAQGAKHSFYAGRQHE